LFVEATWLEFPSFFFFIQLVEYSKFFSPWVTWLDIPNPLLYPKQLGWGYWLVPFSPMAISLNKLPKGYYYFHLSKRKE
jgi:hypothetical protein